METQELAGLLLENFTGATFYRESGKSADFDAGYFVGGEVDAVSIPDCTPYIDALSIVNLWLLKLPKTVTYVGIWLNTETGKVWLDASTYFAREVEALAVAKLRGEDAIFDLYYHREINVD